MGIDDRDYHRERRQVRGQAAPSSAFGARLLGLLNASFSVGTYLGIRVRVHATFVVLLLFWAMRDMNLLATAKWVAILFGSVLLHEFGHCLACRRVGGRANEVLLWPLGGLAECHPPSRPRAEFVTVAGGPLVNLVLALACYLTLFLLHGAASPVSFNPLSPLIAPATGATQLLALGFAVNWILFLFNALLPIYPLDGGRLLQVALWTQIGRVESLRLSCRIGMAGAVIVGLVGLAANRSLLVVIAVFGFHACYVQGRQLGSSHAPSARPAKSNPLSAWLARRKAARTQAHARKRRELTIRADAILSKLYEQGEGSLSWRERRILRRVMGGDAPKG